MITKTTRDVMDMVTRPVLDAIIKGGTIDAMPIGQTTPAAGRITVFARYVVFGW